MKVLLTNDVVGLGDIGQAVNVKPGYARNFLIPRGFAVESGAASAKSVAHKMKQIEAKKNRMQVEAEKEAAAIGKIKVQIGLRVGRGGKVFGSVTTRQIAQKLAEQDVDIDRRRILLPEPIKKLGKKEVRVKLHSNVVPTIEVEIVAIAATAEEERLETQEAKEVIEAVAEERDEADEAAEGEVVEEAPDSDEDISEEK